MAETDVDVESLIHSGDFARLREELTFLRPQEIAGVLAALRADEQVIAFRILPRRIAASVFEYLSGEQQRALVKAMGQEDVAELLNQMAPDDRTLFLSELPDDASLHRGPRRLDGPAGARLRPRPRSEQRNAERHLRHRRCRVVDR